jgi:TMEM175 potassium channel family protein
MPTNRLEAFSDGVFAIAATLLILNVAVSTDHLSDELLKIWPSYVAYAVSFVTIGIIWANHHTVMGQISHVNRTFLVINTLFLMVVSFIPFPTHLLSEYILDPNNAQPAAIVYGITGTLVAVMFNIMWRYAAGGRRLLRADAKARTVDGITRSYLPGPFLYAAATAVALASPVVSAGIYAAIALFYVVESSFFGDSEGPG